MSISVERLQSLFLRELAIIINKDRKNDNQPYFNVTEVKISKDKMFATVYYTILSDLEEDILNAGKLLDDLNKAIRHELAQKVKNIRRIPELIFKYDEALAYGNKIDKILKEINKKAE